MKVTLVIVTSIDGKTTHGSEINHYVTWASKEDQEFFFNEIINKAKLIIMGSTTYETSRHLMQHRDGRLRVVITRTPEKYSGDAVPNKLEFTNENPTDLIKRLEDRGFTEGLLVGGANTNTKFFKQGLVTELWQTLEPKILGSGNGIVGDEVVEFSLELISSERLNEKGTLLLKYKVIN